MKVCASSYLLDNILGLKVALNAIKNSFQNIGKHKFSVACTVYIRARKIQFGWSKILSLPCKKHQIRTHCEQREQWWHQYQWYHEVDCIALCSCRRPMKSCSQDELRLRERTLQRKEKAFSTIFSTLNMGTLLFIWLETGISSCSRLGTNAQLALCTSWLEGFRFFPFPTFLQLFFVVGRIRTIGSFRTVLIGTGLRGIHGIDDVISTYLCEDIQQCCCIFVALRCVELSFSNCFWNTRPAFQIWVKCMQIVWVQ